MVSLKIGGYAGVSKQVRSHYPASKNKDSQLQIPILCYHSANIVANDYRNNDHIALKEDLALLQRKGFIIVSLEEIVTELISGNQTHQYGKKVVGLSFDDGTDYDFFDLVHETCGFQISFYSVLAKASKKRMFSKRWVPHATCFVIASPDDRKILDRTSMAGRDRWRDVWWSDAVKSGLIHIGNHSWDHLSEALPTVAHSKQLKGNFYCVDNWGDADLQIRNASSYINKLAPNPGASLFAYPYGEYSDYLIEEYLPKNYHEHGVKAAFTTEPEYVTPQTNRWKIPRFVCGAHWTNTDELFHIIKTNL